MALLPNQILPETEPVGISDGTSVIITHNWYLLLYNIASKVLGLSGLPASALQELAATDADVIDTDAIALRRAIDNALVQAIQASDAVPSPDDLPDIARALLLAQDGLSPDPAPLAQPSASIAVAASPFVYTAPFAGSVAITGGTVSAIALMRQGVSVATGVTVGLIPVARGDGVQVTYSVAPTMTFIPWSSA